MTEIDNENMGAENSRDEADILADKDQVESMDLTKDEQRTGGMMSRSVEDEPDQFIRGEVDVKTQMDRAARAFDADTHDYSDRSRSEDDRIPNV